MNVNLVLELPDEMVEWSARYAASVRIRILATRCIANASTVR